MCAAGALVDAAGVAGAIYSDQEFGIEALADLLLSEVAGETHRLEGGPVLVHSPAGIRTSVVASEAYYTPIWGRGLLVTQPKRENLTVGYDTLEGKFDSCCVPSNLSL